MFGTIFGLFLIFVVKAFSATVPQPSPGLTVLSDAFAVPSQSGNTSLDGPTSGKGLEITCDHLLGSGLRVTSCKNLFPLIRKGTEQFVFAERTSQLQYDVNLPFRIQNLDGTCAVEVLLKDGKATGRMDYTEFGTAAYTLFDVCVVHYGYGGIAENIGGDNNLQVALGGLKPTVKCDKRVPGPDFLSCADILSKMETSSDKVTFGRRAGPGVNHTLPAFLLSTDSKCVVKIDSTTQATAITTWYDIWQGINSIAYMCTAQTHFGGKAFKIGSLSTITIEMSAEQPGAGFPNAALLNASSGEAALLTLPAGAQNVSSGEASLILPSLPAPYLT